MTGKKSTCGQNCKGKYCFKHNKKIRDGSKPPTPCKSCGVGVRSVTECVENMEAIRNSTMINIWKEITEKSLPM